MTNSAGIRYQFGAFEVNAASGELLKHGKRVKLQEQPFRLLVVLLEVAGEVVTRVELQDRIWPKNTFVDFDSSLRVAVRKLREALEDDADNPHYIETLPKRGYRFLGPVVQQTRSTERIAETEEAPTLPGLTMSLATSGVDPVNPKPAPSRYYGWIASALFLIVVVVVGIFALLFRSKRVLTEKDTVILADFANSTGDPVFDETLRQGVAVQLEQSPFLSLISQQRIQQTLGLMGQPADTRLTPVIAPEVCERTGSVAVLDGSIANLGSQYVLGLRAKDCRTGKVLAEEQVQAARKEDVLLALSQIAKKFRTRVGESLTTVELHNTPLAEATTSSLEALKAYSTGLKVNLSRGEAAAAPFFKRATEIDPQFAMAYARLGLMYGAEGESALSAESTSKAYELREHASDAERFFITASYEGRVTGNLEKAQQTCETWAQTYPREVAPHSYLAGFIYPAFGKYQKAIEESRKGIEIELQEFIGYSELAYNYVALDRLGEAETVLRQASELKVDSPDFSVQRYDLAFLKGDKAGMDREVALAQGDTETEDWILYHQEFALAYVGEVQRATTISRQAEALAQQSSHGERAALFRAGSSVWEALLGDTAAAKQGAMAALALSNDREVEYGAGVALALSGDSSRSQVLTDDLEKRFPEDTSVRFSYLPTLRAILALNRGDPSHAIDVLLVAVPYELGTQRSTIHGSFGALYPAYMRGEAYLAAQQGARAVEEFQKILDHRGIVVSDPIGALAHLQLGRAFAISGEKSKAKSAYQEFFTLWKDADSGIPVLKQAKAEYAKLE